MFSNAMSKLFSPSSGVMQNENMNNNNRNGSLRRRRDSSSDEDTEQRDDNLVQADNTEPPNKRSRQSLNEVSKTRVIIHYLCLLFCN